MSKSPLMRDYHDREWGTPLHDDRKLFEFLILEGMQAGLSWNLVLNKRENFRRAFRGFDPEKVARFTARDVRRLLGDAGIIRNRLKILGAINNAKRFLEVRREFGTFDRYIWGFVDGKPLLVGTAVVRADARPDAALRRDQRGPQGARLQVRRLDRRLLAHAGDRHGQRPPRDVLPVPGVCCRRACYENSCFQGQKQQKGSHSKLMNCPCDRVSCCKSIRS